MTVESSAIFRILSAPAANAGVACEEVVFSAMCLFFFKPSDCEK
jgi:hypothetical protein